MDGTRREFLKKSAIASALVWSAPVVSSLPRPAFGAGTPPPPTDECSGSAYDASAVLTGPVNQSVGPIHAFPPADDCFESFSFTTPGGSAPFLSASAFCVDHTFDPQPCETSARVSGVSIDLRNIDPALDIQLTATILGTSASAACGGPSEGTATIAGATLVVAGTATPIAAGTPTTIPLPGGSLVINEQTATSSGIRVRAVHLTVTNALTGQTVEIIIAESFAECTT